MGYDRVMTRGLTFRQVLLTVLLLGFGLARPAAAAEVWLLELDGAIGPASADYFMTTLRDAEEAGVDLFVMRLDTPGGLDQSMRDMIKAILASRVPVVTYVAPNGSHAASAGTYILYASHVAAMAPATNVGSSTPVNIGGPSPFPTPTEPARPPSDEDGEGQPDGSEPAAKPGDGSTAMERKMINDAVAYIRGIAELRGRNVEWAEKTVREAANLTASQALEQNVIDVIADNLDDLLAKLDGREVKLEGGTRTLDLANPNVTHIEPGWRYELLALITDPNVAYILLMIGIYGLILEFYNPGMGVPGVTGLICLLLAAFALQMLPINYAGLALILVGIALMVGEAFTPTFGVLGVGGAIAFVIGSIILMDTDLPGYQISTPVIAAFSAASLALFAFAIGAAFRARQEAVITGMEGMIGQPAVVLEDFSGRGRVRAFGEMWQAQSSVPLTEGTKVRIAAIDGLVLTVEPETERS